MIVWYMKWKHAQGYRCATHITKTFVKRAILFLQCIAYSARSLLNGKKRWLFLLRLSQLQLNDTISLPHCVFLSPILLRLNACVECVKSLQSSVRCDKNLTCGE